jgi:hypothetical protein
MSRKKRLKLVSSETSYMVQEEESRHKVRLNDLKEIYPLTNNQENFFNKLKID